MDFGDVWTVLVSFFSFLGGFWGGPPESGSAPQDISSTGCDESLWDHTYTTDRLDVQNRCVLINGTVDAVVPLPDGDVHVNVRPDPEFEFALTQANRDYAAGTIIVEPVCHHGVTDSPFTDPDAFRACEGYSSNVSIPNVGDHVSVLGAYVLDMDHSGWAEIHPVTSISPAQRPPLAAPAPPRII